MSNPTGSPKTGAIVTVPSKATRPKQFKTGIPADHPHLPEDDFALREQLKALAERILKNLDEVVRIKPHLDRDELLITRREIFHWASNMASDSLVAQMYGVDRNVFQQHFRKEIDLARSLAKYRLQDRLFDVAVSGQNASIMLFCAKNYLNMTDVGLTEALDAGSTLEEDTLVQMTPAQVTALLKNATLTNTISVTKDTE